MSQNITLDQVTMCSGSLLVINYQTTLSHSSTELYHFFQLVHCFGFMGRNFVFVVYSSTHTALKTDSALLTQHQTTDRQS